MEDDHPPSSAGDQQSPKTSVSSDQKSLKKLSKTSRSSETKGETTQKDSDSNDEPPRIEAFDIETTAKKLKYPKSVFFIVVNEFCERFTFYGLRTLLSVYCNKVLRYSVDTSTVIYHSFVSLAYFTPLLGAFIADSFLGKFKTILYLSIVYAIGNVTLTLASADTAIDGMPTRAISILGLVIIAVGTGGIKPCVSAFGGDQFVVPEQQKQLDVFFSIFYFSVNSGSLVSTFLTPILREDVQCLGKDSCYPLAYGIPAILMFVAIIAFVLGKPFYKMKKPKGNVLAETMSVIKHALATKRKSEEEKSHWLDFALDKYSEKTVSDIKAMVRVAYLFIPLPIFWALYDQQGSRWTFQASRMDGRLGGFTLQPEQMQVVNPFLILLFVPLFETVVYPLLARCNVLTKPLPRLGIGGILAGVAFLMSAGVEVGLEPTYAVVPKAGEGQLRFFNALDCPVMATFGVGEERIINSMDVWQMQHVSVKSTKYFTLEVNPTSACPTGITPITTRVPVFEKRAKSYLLSLNSSTQVIEVNGMSFDDPEKNDNTRPKLRIIYNPIPMNEDIYFLDEDKNKSTVVLHSETVGTQYYEFKMSTYTVSSSKQKIMEGLSLEMGGVYSLLLVHKTDGNLVGHLHTITEPNSVHMLLLLPQYIVMTAGEVMFSVTGLQFAFTQAPVSMKSVLTSAWLMTSAVGNVIVAIIAGSRIFDKQIYEFLLFAGIMFIDMIIFAMMAWSYEYVVVDDEDETEESKKVSGLKETGVDNETFQGDHNE